MLSNEQLDVAEKRAKMALSTGLYAAAHESCQAILVLVAEVKRLQKACDFSGQVATLQADRATLERARDQAEARWADRERELVLLRGVEKAARAEREAVRRWYSGEPGAEAELDRNDAAIREALTALDQFRRGGGK